MDQAETTWNQLVEEMEARLGRRRQLQKEVAELKQRCDDLSTQRDGLLTELREYQLLHRRLCEIRTKLGGLVPTPQLALTLEEEQANKVLPTLRPPGK